MVKLSLLAGLALASGLCVQSASADPVVVVAAKNFYGDIAAQVAGAHVEVTSIVTNPDEDPHLFEARPRASARRPRRTASSVPWRVEITFADRDASYPVSRSVTGDNVQSRPRRLVFDCAEVAGIASINRLRAGRGSIKFYRDRGIGARCLFYIFRNLSPSLVLRYCYTVTHT